MIPPWHEFMLEVLYYCRRYSPGIRFINDLPSEIVSELDRMWWETQKGLLGGAPCSNDPSHPG